MSIYSLDSLEDSTDIRCGHDYSELQNIGRAGAPGDCKISINALGGEKLRQVVEKSEGSDPRIAEIPSATDLLKNSLIAEQSESLDQIHPSPSTRTSIRSEKKNYSSRSSSSVRLKHDKKLGDVLAPVIVEAKKTRSKSYLEQYRQRVGVPARQRPSSPEGSTLSVFGDTSYETITDVDSRPPTATPRDDQSELSFYRRLIEQPRTTRSYDAENRWIPNGDLRSISECGLIVSADKRRILSYRPYTIMDYECLTVPSADRSLGPDTEQMRAKWEKLMRRTQYGDLASSRNRQHLVRRSELRKSRRTEFQKNSDDNIPQDEVESKAKESGDTRTCPKFTCRSGNRDQSQRGENVSGANTRGPLGGRAFAGNYENFGDPEPSASLPGLKNTGRTLSRGPKHLTRISSESRPSRKSSDLRSPAKTSLEELQLRHSQEKRLMDLLINRTLLD